MKPDPDLVPGAFHIDGLHVYAYSPVEGAPYQRQFSGLIVHRDLFGRYASHSF